MRKISGFHDATDDNFRGNSLENRAFQALPPLTAAMGV